MMILSLYEPIDPRFLQVNRRTKHSHWVPTQTKQAMKQLDDAVRLWFADHPWIVTKDPVYRVELVFGFPSWQSDIDGPVKRTLDAVFRSMRAVTDSPKANDARISNLTVQKLVGPECFVAVMVEALDK